MQEDAPAPAPSTSAPRAPAKVTQKMRERAAYEKELRDEDAMDSADEALEVFEGEDVEMDDAPSKGKGKEVASTADEKLPVARKRRRPAMDVFTGVFHLVYFSIPNLINYPTGLSEEPSADTVKKSKASSPSLPTIPQSIPSSKSGSSTPAISEKSKSSSKKTKKKSKK